MTSNATYNNKTGGIEVAKAYSAQASGKTILVTGVTLGSIGDGVVRAFAEGGASKIIITGRKDDRLAAALEAYTKDYPSTSFRGLKLNLNNLKEVEKSAKEILNDSSIPQIDILVANAGANVQGDKPSFTDDGIELMFGSNHLAHHLFIKILFPKIEAAAKKNPPGATRIINTSSMSAFFSPVRFSNIYFEEGKVLPEDEKPNWDSILAFGLVDKPTDGWHHHLGYAQSKTANVLHSVSLNTRLASKGIYSFALHPGMVDSNGARPFWEQFTPEQKAVADSIGGIKTVDQGAATTIVAALDPALKPENGIWLSDAQLADALPYMTDKEKAEKLWKLSDELAASKL